MKLNTLKLTRYNGDELFGITEASIYFADDKTELSLDFKTGKPLSVPLLDTKIRGGLSGEFWIQDIKISSLKELEGQSFYIKDGYDNEDYETCSTFYYYQHQTVSENTIEFIKYTNEYFLVKITANTCDVINPNNSKPETKIELTANFKID